MANRQRRKQLWEPVDTYDEADIRSVQLLAMYAKGAEQPWPPGDEPPVPTPHDVKRVFDLVVHKLSQRYEDPAMAAFEAKDPNVVWYMSGRLSVGKALSKIMVLRAEHFKGK